MLLDKKAYLVAALLLFGGAFAFADHPRDMAKAVGPCLQGNLKPAEKILLKEAQKSGRNQLLYLYELGGLANLVGDFAKSAAYFDRADQVAHEYEGRAVASVSGGFGQAGASLTNDTLLPWEGACFDKVMARTLNALNYLAQMDLEGARVEVRKAEEYQTRERERSRKAVDRADPGFEAKNIDSSDAASKYRQMYSFVRNVRNSYENAFTYYLASHIYRAQGREGLNDALVDIKQAYALAPQSPAVQMAYLDLLAQCPGSEAASPLRELRANLGVEPDWMPSGFASTGTVVVLYEAGFAPQLSEVAIDLFLPSADRFSMAFPIYNDFGGLQPPLQIQAGTIRRTTTRLVDLRQLAVKSLQERMPAIFARGTLGALGKIQAQKKAEEGFGILGKMLAGIVTQAVTNADLRSWLSLPAEVQVAQLVLAPGARELLLSGNGWLEKATLQVLPGSTTFVTVRAVPGRRTLTVTSLPPGDPPLEPADSQKAGGLFPLSSTTTRSAS